MPDGAPPPDVPRGCGPLGPAPAGRAASPRRQAFDHVRAQGRSARAEMARALGISAASVTGLAADLIALGLLREVEGASSPRDPGRGRPPVALQVVGEARHVVGLKLSEERHSAVLADLSGAWLGEVTLAARAGRKRLADVLDEVEALMTRVRAAAGGRAVDAVGIGLPGLVDHEGGRVARSPLLAEPDLAFREACAGRLGLPVHISSDADVLTLAELWFGAGRGRANFAVVTVEQGVGLGLVQGARLVRRGFGRRGSGPDLGHMKVQLDGALCRCGQRGCLEAYVADHALAREAAVLLGCVSQGPQGARGLVAALIAEARAGNTAARGILARAGRHLAHGLANVVHLLDPGLLILSGERMLHDILPLDEILAEMRALLAGREAPTVEVHAWGDLVWAQGAAALALEAVTDTALGA